MYKDYNSVVISAAIINPKSLFNCLFRFCLSPFVTANFIDLDELLTPLYFTLVGLREDISQSLFSVGKSMCKWVYKEVHPLYP